jgi:hypothetical protein
MFLQEVVDLSIFVFGALNGSTTSQGFSLDKVVSGGSCEGLCISTFLYLVDDTPPTSYGVFQHIQCFDVRSQFSIN